jgi:hypothetical protein
MYYYIIRELTNKPAQTFGPLRISAEIAQNVAYKLHRSKKTKQTLILRSIYKSFGYLPFIKLSKTKYLGL